MYAQSTVDSQHVSSFIANRLFGPFAATSAAFVDWQIWIPPTTGCVFVEQPPFTV